MWYIFQNGDGYSYSKDEPGVSYITVARISPIPSKFGYEPMLHADLDTGNIWWTLEQTEAGHASEVRTKRDSLLTETDWTQCLDAPISTESQLEMRSYRQSLRDLTEQESFPLEVVWPEMPDIAKDDPDPVDEAIDLMLSGEEVSEDA